jgi:hypothetical protein
LSVTHQLHEHHIKYGHVKQWLDYPPQVAEYKPPSLRLKLKASKRIHEGKVLAYGQGHSQRIIDKQFSEPNRQATQKINRLQSEDQFIMPTDIMIEQ